LAIVKKYRTIVKSIEHPLADIYIVTLTSLNGSYHYRPGQFLQLTLDEYDPSMPWPDARCFSIQTNPEHPDIKITFSVRGSFTRRMAVELMPGRTIWVKLPYGELFLEDTSKEHCVFIAGGTGITPYLSLFTSSQFRAYSQPVLYWGIKNADYHVYHSEFAGMARTNSEFKIHISMEDQDGMLNIEAIFRTHGLESTYFISGPPLMLRTFHEYLVSHDVQGPKIKFDAWK
jgi:predicted ferric reductase